MGEAIFLSYAPSANAIISTWALISKQSEPQVMLTADKS